MKETNPTSNWWHNLIWRWNLPTKLRCFIWLCLKDKILTWPNLLKRGFTGPNICILCKKDEEDTTHLFVHCSFLVKTWSELQRLFDFQAEWTGINLDDCFYRWTQQNPTFKTLPIFVIWEIWRSINKALFESSSVFYFSHL